ncbi:DUF3152 domain-containing protein [Streptomyces sp. CA-249302]|uniref:DUF3152 domain-containing protein n=1 Tax=Streptomyces sp. CA-249302 TaxID=3240058 RepID=UPI003D916002
MTTHKDKRSSRRRTGSAHAAPRGSGRQLAAGLAALGTLGVVGFAVVAWLPADAKHSPMVTDAVTGAEHTPSASSTSRPPKAKPSPTPKPSRTEEHRIAIPQSGPGTFVTAPGRSAVAGKGKVLLYKVEVENGIDVSPAEAAKEVERILADPRGWTADGHSAFRRVSSGPTDFEVRIATPDTVDTTCKQYGLDTIGEYNCSVDHNVMVNLKRWVLATPVYAKDVTSYRALIVNHEVGHFLGHGHVTCPGKGEPAPAMMQQIKGMLGCVPNVWPYDAEGRLITGPAVP